MAPEAHAGSVPPRLARQWPETDFSSASVRFDEIQSGGVPRDGIPAVTGPAMRRVGSETRICTAEPVTTVELAGAVPRAYPLRYLTWHEIVN
ncbi:MAG: DUF3179 domain-containing protein, partial [Rhodobacteraceae bacterium]|nr:DUF3179 domain-containing protein [Paracoccaceae bacterium]